MLSRWIMLGVAVLCSLVGVAAVAEDNKPIEELKIDLPKAMFVGTPKDIKSSRLDPNTGKDRPPFMVPAGTVKLSEGKPVTVSDGEPVIGESEMVTDGDKEAADGSFIEFGPGPQWVQVDLGQSCELHAILIWHYHSQALVYRDVIAQVSDNPDFVTGVTTLFNNDYDNTSKLGVGSDYEYIETREGRLIEAKGVMARYVRLYSNGNTSNDMNHMIEVEVFGR